MTSAASSDRYLTLREVSPGGGGSHDFFRNPRIRTVNDVAPGIDVRDNAAVILPPSLHKSGRRYAWERGPEEIAFAELSSGWLGLITFKRPQHGYRSEVLAEGWRDVRLTQIAGAFRR